MNQVQPFAGSVQPMPQYNKGDRAGQTIRPEREVMERVKQRAAAAGVSSVSQYVADLLAVHVGLPHLVRELNRDEEVLPLAM
ncbi:toxin-antitoxin system [Mycobacterium intracellulare]|uniref:toxin-antitoxin system n=1 Tax=Mycobacterium intracellulare TaxID=1767 RepID=UPI001F5238FA|nr:toxin-antitoxin system [Mycobacterium intracellulare]